MEMSKPTVNIGYYIGSNYVEEGDGKYYYNGGSTNIVLTEEDYSSGTCLYKKHVHKPEYGSKIGNIHYNNGWVTLFPAPKDYYSVTVYYGEHDEFHKYPLILQLGDDYYTTASNQRWNRDISITSISLKRNLDIQNCARASVHIVNISQTRGISCSGKSGYQRPSVTADKSKERIHGYTRYTHSSQPIKPFSVSLFIDGSIRQTGIIPLPKDVMEINVYFPVSHQQPMLIHFEHEGDKWFKRISPTENSWIEITAGADNRPENKSDHEHIKKNIKVLTSHGIYGKTQNHGTGSHPYTEHNLVRNTEEKHSSLTKYKKIDPKKNFIIMPSSTVAILGVAMAIVGTGLLYMGLRTYIRMHSRPYRIIRLH
ncbi:hypothetical protein BEWA_016680 [Theileria equi strain WA]|uniref:Uncharacterized protein n=1 Tax=Theileria equi strain WA TaxID=1537102 RepID=L1L9X9_THEEQ|nr:hypothetical protein BEWA_016680 [Theileria equi strain WA]EKX71990.1 hypothetical protein BEWA_016680 [Theileria equi strain WA]|eukprot:XP_004831442.1 hypothetical protein BEWA_016680 [Theileria equi strain WA]